MKEKDLQKTIDRMLKATKKEQKKWLYANGVDKKWRVNRES